MSLGEYTYENAKALNTLKREHGIEPQFFENDIMVKIGRLSEDVVRELGTSDRQTQKIYESYKSARDKFAEWTDMSDGRYIRARSIALQSL